jgi:hypothetical protein
MPKKQILKGYGLKTGGILTYNFFAYRRDAVAYAKYQVSNHPEIDWHKVYTVVKVTLEEN